MDVTHARESPGPVALGEAAEYMSPGDVRSANKMGNYVDNRSLRDQITALLHLRVDLSATDRVKLASTVTDALRSTQDNPQTPHQIAQRLMSAFDKQRRRRGELWGPEEMTKLSRIKISSNLVEEWGKLCSFSPQTFRPRTKAALLKKWQRINAPPRPPTPISSHENHEKCQCNKDCDHDNEL